MLLVSLYQVQTIFIFNVEWIGVAVLDISSFITSQVACLEFYQGEREKNWNCLMWLINFT